MPSQTPFAIISPKTAAVTTEVMFNLTRDLCPCIITCVGAGTLLATSEEIDVYFSTDGGTNWEVLYDFAAGVPGTALKLKAAATELQSLVFKEPVVLGFKKDTTAGAVGLWAFKGL